MSDHQYYYLFFGGDGGVCFLGKSDNIMTLGVVLYIYTFMLDVVKVHHEFPFVSCKSMHALEKMIMRVLRVYMVRWGCLRILVANFMFNNSK